MRRKGMRHIKPDVKEANKTSFAIPYRTVSLRYFQNPVILGP